jgi:hypothetical protein
VTERSEAGSKEPLGPIYIDFPNSPRIFIDRTQPQSGNADVILLRPWASTNFPPLFSHFPLLVQASSAHQALHRTFSYCAALLHASVPKFCCKECTRSLLQNFFATRLSASGQKRTSELCMFRRGGKNTNHCGLRIVLIPNRAFPHPNRIRPEKPSRYVGTLR